MVTKAEFEAAIARICVLEQALKLVTEKLATIESENGELKTTVDRLQVRKPSDGKLFSDFAAQLAKPGSVANSAIVSAIATNAQHAATKACNVLVAGVALSTKSDPNHQSQDDIESMNEILTAIHVNAKIVKATRLRPRTSAVNKTANAKPSHPLLLVQFESESVKSNVIRNARNLAQTDDYKEIFIHPDRTPAEQVAFSKLVTAKNELNRRLEDNKTYNLPFRFVICSGQVRCIDTKRTKDHNGSTVHPFVNMDFALQQSSKSTSLSEEATSSAHRQASLKSIVSDLSSSGTSGVVG